MNRPCATLFPRGQVRYAFLAFVVSEEHICVKISVDSAATAQAVPTEGIAMPRVIWLHDFIT
eukprot:COSAG02_NODE_70137_length_197_cov_32.785714_1_plen_62_part_01